MTAAEQRQKRRDDELAYHLLMVCWRIKAKAHGDTGEMNR